MSVYIFWVSVALIALFLLVGFLSGLGRGLKRSALHIVFMCVSVLIAFFVTNPITNMIMGITIPAGEAGSMTIEAYIMQMISDNVVDISNFDSASAFIQGLPTAIVNPLIFIILTLVIYFVLHLIYLIVARIAFGKKKKDFSSHKPYRLPGAVIGMVEGFLFLVILFAPITSLTNTYAQVMGESVASAYATEELSSTDKNYLQTVGDIASENMPSEVGDIIYSINDSAIGKICSVAGLNDAMFDGLSSFEVNGEKIVIRDEIVSIVNAYDSFVVFYNTAIDENYDDLDFSALKGSLTYVIENNLFKSVIAETIGDVIVNFDTLEQDMNIEMPEMARDVIVALQDRFANADFSAYDYLSHDLLIMLDIADEIVSKDLVSKMLDLNTSEIASLFDFATSNRSTLSIVLKDFADMNLVGDTLPIWLDFANESLSTSFENDRDLIVGINPNLTQNELKDSIASLFDGEDAVIAQLSALDTNYDILSIFESEDVLDSILKINNIDVALTDLGGILDDINGMTIFNYIIDSGNEQVAVHSFENILRLSNIDVLGDVVTDSTGADLTLDTYEKFFTYMSRPIKTIIDSDLTSVVTEGADFDQIIDTLCLSISGETDSEKNLEFLSDILMPFYELDEAQFAGQTLKNLVFDTVTSLLRDNLGDIVDLSTTADTENYDTWNDRLISVASLIDILNSGEMSVAGSDETQTYLKYFLNADNADYFELVTTMNSDDTLSRLLDVVFSNQMYTPINETLFSTIDEQVGNFTGVAFETNLDNLYTDRDQYIMVITSLIDSLDSGLYESQDLTTQLTALGEMLDTLKLGASENVFDALFCNLIWYMTNDPIDMDNMDNYTGKDSPFEHADKVREFLDADSVEGGYYGIDYSGLVDDLVDFIEFGNEVYNTFINTDFTNAEDREQFVASLNDAVANLGDSTHAQDIIDTATNIVNVVLTDDQLSEIKEHEETITELINSYDSETTALTEDIKTSLLALLFGQN